MNELSTEFYKFSLKNQLNTKKFDKRNVYNPALIKIFYIYTFAYPLEIETKKSKE